MGGGGWLPNFPFRKIIKLFVQCFIKKMLERGGGVTLAGGNKKPCICKPKGWGRRVQHPP